MFTDNRIQKTYFGIVRGFVDLALVIDSPVKNPDTRIYKDAETFCEPINKILLEIPVTPYENSRYSLVKLTPATGRMHQLRIHLNKINHPIVGDYKYGDRFHNRMFEQEYNCKNLFLHAHSLYFTQPITNDKIELNASFPDDWIKIFKLFEWDFN